MKWRKPAARASWPRQPRPLRTGWPATPSRTPIFNSSPKEVRMPVKVTFESAPLVWIVVLGKKMEGVGNRDDGGLIHHLLNFLQEEGIVHSPFGGLAGDGRMS